MFWMGHWQLIKNNFASMRLQITAFEKRAAIMARPLVNLVFNNFSGESSNGWTHKARGYCAVFTHDIG